MLNDLGKVLKIAAEVDGRPYARTLVLTLVNERGPGCAADKYDCWLAPGVATMTMDKPVMITRPTSAPVGTGQDPDTAVADLFEKYDEKLRQRISTSSREVQKYESLRRAEPA